VNLREEKIFGVVWPRGEIVGKGIRGIMVGKKRGNV